MAGQVPVSPRLEIDWSKTFHIIVRKPKCWLISVCFLATRGVNNGLMFVKDESGLALTPMSVSDRLEVDCSKF